MNIPSLITLLRGNVLTPSTSVFAYTICYGICLVSGWSVMYSYELGSLVLFFSQPDELHLFSYSAGKKKHVLPNLRCSDSNPMHVAKRHIYQVLMQPSAASYLT